MGVHKLLYSFVSSAYDVYEDWAEGTPVTGMKRIAKLAHQHGVPVTWSVNSVSSERCKDLLEQWHQQYGDAVILFLTIHKRPDRGINYGNTETGKFLNDGMAPVR